MKRLRRVVAAVLVLGATNCVTPRKDLGLVTPTGTFRVAFVEWNESTGELLQQTIPEAAQALTRWGGLQEPVQITVVNSHWELEELVGRKLPGISAWARAREVYLSDPARWPLPPGLDADAPLARRIRRTQLTDLLKHELTHCLMFQRAGPTPADLRERIPFWFREGMASVTAGEGAQWPPLEALGQWLAAHPGVDLLRDTAAIARTDPAIAYGAAYHAFQFVLRTHGDASVLAVLDRMASRSSFPEAFQSTLHLTVASFSNAFQLSLVDGSMPREGASGEYPQQLLRRDRLPDHRERLSVHVLGDEARPTRHLGDSVHRHHVGV